MSLAEKEQKHLTAAHGYLELGMPLDADAELERIDPSVRHYPAVLSARVEVYRRLEKWELMQSVAKRLVDYNPDNVQWIVWLAFATRRAVSIESAKAILLEAVERDAKAAILHYNLACYECVMGDVEVAKARLEHAIKLDASIASTQTQLPFAGRKRTILDTNCVAKRGWRDRRLICAPYEYATSQPRRAGFLGRRCVARRVTVGISGR